MSIYKYIVKTTKNGKPRWIMNYPGASRKVFIEEMDAAKAIDKYLISKGKDPVNILKPVLPEKGDRYKYILNGWTATVIRITGPKGIIELQRSIDGYNFTLKVEDFRKSVRRGSFEKVNNTIK